MRIGKCLKGPGKWDQIWWIVAADQGYSWSYPSDSFRRTHAHMGRLRSGFNLNCRDREYKAFYLGWILLRLIRVNKERLGLKIWTQQADVQTWTVCSQQPLWWFTAAYFWVGHAQEGGGVWSYHHMCDVVSHAADVQLSAPVPLSVPDCSVLARGLLVPCGSVKTGHIPICASGCI